ncbi:MAG TPA: hypothetical protein VGO53_16265 [Steroidobacteraceae bacterium]|jgi:hypothetical protein|nr:hypothetical protein [Steroidobacteraceae bacterium]
MTHIETVIGVGLFIYLGLVAQGWIAKIADGPATRVQTTARIVGGLLTVLALVLVLLSLGAGLR